MILMQRDCNDMKFHPVYYASGKTTSAEEKYTSYELEVLAIIKALKKFRVYLLGIKFKIVTDCQAFALTMKKKDLSTRIARWALLLEEFSYEICHRPGNNMKHVDALSRNPLPSILLMNECKDSIMSRLICAQKSDKELCKIVDDAEHNKVTGYTLRNGLLCREVNGDILIVVPKLMQSTVVRQAHERGHFGVNKTEAILREDFWFKGMRQKIEQVLKSCLNCILAERKQGKPEGLLHSIGKGDVPLDTFHIDHVGPMTATKKKYQYILVVVDAFTKFVWLYPKRATDTAEVIDRLDKQSSVFGDPRRIISDRGTAFTSNAFQEFCHERNIQHIKITTRLPRSNGQVERVNRTLIPLLTKLAAPSPENWYKHVEVAQRWINAVPSRSTQRTPFQLLFGVKMRLKEDSKMRELIEQEWTARFEEHRDELREAAKNQIIKVQEENKRGYDRKHKESIKYQAGDLVAIKRTQFGPGLKLCAKFRGPYKVTRVMRNDWYSVAKIGEHEGPMATTTSADHMKPWLADTEEVFSDDNQDEDI